MTVGEGPAPADPLGEIATALFRLRCLWSRPDFVRRIGPGTPGGRPLQLSNLMVVQAIADLDPSRPGTPRREVTVGAVAERLQVDPSTASRLVGYAIDAGLVSRQPSPSDARRADLRLTETGRRVEQAADRWRRAFLTDLTDGWTDTERAQFARLLARFTDALGHHSGIDPERIGRIFHEATADDS